jgi:vitamin B12 transporter
MLGGFMRKILFYFCFLSVSASTAAQASDDAITVTATGFDQPVDQSGQAISVVDQGELQSLQGPDLTRALQRLPGISISRNGGLGAFTAVRVRGAESEQTLVLVDGVPMADVSSPSGGFDFGTLMAGNVEKIELLRGSNSVVWGSDAIGGVIAVTTRQLQGVEASAEYGAYQTFSGAAAAGFQTGGLGLTLDGGYVDSQGFSQLASDSENDGFRQWQAGGRATYDFGSGLSAFVDARYADSKVGLDYSFADDYVQTTSQISTRAGLKYAGQALQLTGYYALSDTRRDYDSPTFGGYFYTGIDQRVALDGRWTVLPQVALLFGGGHEWSRFDGTFNAREADDQSNGHALLDVTLGGLDVAGGVRLDHHSRFGDAWTLGGNASLALGHGWRLRASYGEGFKAPTLYQLFDPYSGNAALRPERSRSFDAGIEHGTRNGALHFAATVFRRDSRDLIDYDYSANGGFGGYLNVGRTRATGVELEGDARPTASLALRAAYTYVKSVDRDTGETLLRRPRNVLSLSADWTTPLHDLALGGDIYLASGSRDLDASLAPVVLDGYALATVRASLPIGPHLELFGRIENLSDARYQVVSGYNTPGRAGYIGVRARM